MRGAEQRRMGADTAAAAGVVAATCPHIRELSRPIRLAAHALFTIASAERFCERTSSSLASFLMRSASFARLRCSALTSSASRILISALPFASSASLSASEAIAEISSADLDLRRITSARAASLTFWFCRIISALCCSYAIAALRSDTALALASRN